MTAPRTERPNIPRAKRDGLDLDLEALCARGADALAPDDHYRLKTYGVCSQRQDALFMMRLRVAGGRLDAPQVAAVARASRQHADGMVHLTTRQNLELHSVALGDAPLVHAAMAPVGLLGRSACGHTIRNVMACPESATSIDEPFDVLPDAVRLSALLVARSSELNVALPSRINIVLGGCPACGQDALTNDLGLVACVRDGVPGYQLWVGGSLATAPRLSFLLRPFVSREEAWPAVWTVIEWFCREGDLDQVARGRLKFLIEERGEATFRQAFAKRFPEVAAMPQPPLDPVDVPGPAELEHCLALAPETGWTSGVRPERDPGRATVVARVPLGDVTADALEALVELAPDGVLHLSRDQNVVFRSVPVDAVPALLAGIRRLGLAPDDPAAGADVRACPGTTFCSLALTDSQDVAGTIEAALARRPDLPRRVSIAASGCPNACVKHQASDIGLAGTKFRLDGRTELGYQLFLGADLAAGRVGEPCLKVTADEVPSAVVAVLELWAALRRDGEALGTTVRRVGLDRVGAAIARRMRP